MKIVSTYKAVIALVLEDGGSVVLERDMANFPDIVEMAVSGKHADAYEGTGVVIMRLSDVDDLIQQLSEIRSLVNR